ncbi:MAG: carbonic anhydrase [Thermoplasmata archaeon]
MQAAAADRKGRLLEGNMLFRKTVDPALLSNLANAGQKPSIAILACSDSRVVPEKIFSLSLGDAFVVRVAGNTASDGQVLGSLEYAVDHLPVSDVVVLGHTDCGAAKLALEGIECGNLARVAKELERTRCKLPPDRSKDPDALSEANVRSQLIVIRANSPIVEEAVRSGRVRLYGAMYDVRTGSVRFL